MNGVIQLWRGGQIMAVSPRLRSALQLVADHNPFYLLSAASMLLACVLLSNTTTYQPIGLGRLVALIVTLGVYELLLVGLGLYLVARRGIVRDGVVLLAVEAFFLADIGFLASETYQHSLTAGLVISGVLLIVAATKVGVIFHVLRMPLKSAAFGAVMFVLAVLLLHPAWLKWVSTDDNGRVPALAMYGLWWMAGVAIAVYGLAYRSGRPADFRGTLPGIAGAGVARAGVGHLLVIVPLASLVAHLGTAHWVYKSPFFAADLSPLFVALPVLFSRLPTVSFYRRSDAAALCVLLLAAGVLTSVGAPKSLTLWAGATALTPVMPILMAAYLVFIDSFAARHFVRYALGGAAVGAAYAFGPTLATWESWLVRVQAWISGAMPRSQTAWGVLALAGAFVMLAVGAAVSLLRPKGPPADAGSPTPPPSDGPPSVPSAADLWATPAVAAVPVESGVRPSGF